MLKIGNVLVSDEIIEEQFVCDLQTCKGACCVEGELGAPLEDEEIETIGKIFFDVKDFITQDGLAEIEKKGLYVKDVDGDYSTPVIKGRECVYAFYGEDAILKCAIEQAFNKGWSAFRKPISCHMYPIRITYVGQMEALNYHRWEICDPARENGCSLKVPIYKFCKDALKRRYGSAWYQELCEVAEAWQNRGAS